MDLLKSVIGLLPYVIQAILKTFYKSSCSVLQYEIDSYPSIGFRITHRYSFTCIILTTQNHLLLSGNFLHNGLFSKNKCNPFVPIALVTKAVNSARFASKGSDINTPLLSWFEFLVNKPEMRSSLPQG